MSFKLLSEGQLSQLTINGGKAILQRAARQALDDAMPLPTPPASFDANQYIEFSMVFTLSGSALSLSELSALSMSHSVETAEKP